MAKKRHELLWKFREDTASEISQLQQSDIDDWLDEQSMLTAAYSDDVTTVVQLLELELSARGISLRIH